MSGRPAGLHAQSGITHMAPPRGAGAPSCDAPTAAGTGRPAGPPPACGSAAGGDGAGTPPRSLLPVPGTAAWGLQAASVASAAFMPSTPRPVSPAAAELDPNARSVEAGCPG